MYGECRNGHQMWLTQTSCPKCGGTLRTVDTPPATYWGAPAWPTTTVALPPEQLAQVQRLVRRDEHLLWAGRPDPSVHFTSADGYLIPFSILWGGFAISWETAAIVSRAGLFVLFDLPFVAMGLYITIGRFLYKARQKRKTLYVLTNRRAIVLVGNQQSETPWQYTPQQISRHRDGRHVDVVFQAAAYGPWNASRQAAMYANTGMDFFKRGSVGVGFFDVADVDSLLGALGQRNSRRSPPPRTPAAPTGARAATSTRP
jgi:hypothetical protein